MGSIPVSEAGPQRGSTGWGGALLRLYAWLVGYRFPGRIAPTLEFPAVESEPETLGDDAVRDKAGTGLNAAGLLLGFSVAILAVLVDKFFDLEKFKVDKMSGSQMIASVAIFVLLFATVRQERVLSRGGTKTKRYWGLLILLAASVLVLAFPHHLIRLFSRDATWRQQVWAFAGAIAIVVSVLFQVFAVEFYDTAAGWRGGKVLRYHLAVFAAHSFLIGLCLVLLGVSLLLALVNFRLGSLLTLATLFVLVAMTEIERELWMRRPLQPKETASAATHARLRDDVG